MLADMRTTIMSVSALLLTILFLSGCGGDSDTPSQAPVPELAEIAGIWVPVPADATQASVPTGEVLELTIAPDGLVILLEEIPGLVTFTSNYRQYVGSIEPSVFGYSGSVAFFPPVFGGLDANSDTGEPVQTGKDNVADIRLIFSSNTEIFVEIEFDDATLLQFALIKSGDLPELDEVVDSGLVGTWTDEPVRFDPLLPALPVTTVTFDDAGSGVGVYRDVCLLEAELTGLVEQQVARSIGGTTEVALVHQANLLAVGCEEAARFSGIAYISRTEGLISGLQFYLPGPDRLIPLLLRPQAL
jgi:hypothetical protein